jgi:hypothetical protein
MLGEDFQQLWLDLFELRGRLDIAARHALDDQALDTHDEQVIAEVLTLRTRADALSDAHLTDEERVALSTLEAAITACEGRCASYLLAVARPDPMRLTPVPPGTG